MREADASGAQAGSGQAIASTEAVIRQCVAHRLKSWALVAGLPLLLVLANLALFLIWQIRETQQLRRELEALRAASVPWGQPVEIHNPAWGTVLDALDPARFPSRDARDPRLGAAVQQYLPRGNAAQAWHLRPPSGPTERNAPLPLQAHLKHGFSFLTARDPVRAAQSFEYCLQLYPDTADAHGGLAVAWRDRGDFARALANHDRAIELEPDRPQFRWERAVTRLRQGDAVGAIQDCEKALEQSPDLADACNTLGIAHRQQRSYVDALKHHDRAVELNPQREDFWRERAATHQANGDSQRSAADLARAREIRESRR